ncbi:MAG: hypothetical protein V3S24_12665, partial [Candidatus Tectomicrobia bacterium]
MGSRYALSRKSVDRRLNVWRGVTVFLVMGIWSIQTGLAQAPAMSARVLELSLEDAIRLALQHNLDIERERFSP